MIIIIILVYGYCMELILIIERLESLYYLRCRPLVMMLLECIGVRVFDSVQKRRFWRCGVDEDLLSQLIVKKEYTTHFSNLGLSGCIHVYWFSVKNLFV